TAPVPRFSHRFLARFLFRTVLHRGFKKINHFKNQHNVNKTTMRIQNVFAMMFTIRILNTSTGHTTHQDGEHTTIQ
ncbi:hypothetical protein ACV2IZ_23425, partial [Salmonella enterica subsp. enterica serovar Braenderup]